MLLPVFNLSDLIYEIIIQIKPLITRISSLFCLVNFIINICHVYSTTKKIQLGVSFCIWNRQEFGLYRFNKMLTYDTPAYIYSMCIKTN